MSGIRKKAKTKFILVLDARVEEPRFKRHEKDFIKLARKILRLGIDELIAKKELPRRTRYTLSAVLIPPTKMRGLNAQFRGKNKPTNVLSFPSDEETYLGDILLCAPVIAEEALEQGKSFKDHLTHLLLHGLLHLAGFDHGTKAQAKEMEAIEIDVLQRVGIANPYKSI